MFFRILTVLLFTTTFATAQTDLPTLAEDGIAKRLASLSPSDPSTQYEFAFLTALRALEKAAQSQIREGFGRTLQSNPIFGFGRINSRPTVGTTRPDALTKITTTLLDDLDLARAALSHIETPETASFELNVNDIWFDLNQDGARDQSEGAATVMRPILGRQAVTRAAQLQKETETEITIRFDHADIAWLWAYTHMLSAVGKATLAFDPTPVIANLQTGRANLKNAPKILPFFDLATVRKEIEELKTQRKTIMQERRALSKEIDPLDKVVKALNRSLRTEEDNVKAAGIRKEIEKLRTTLDPLNTDVRRLSRLERNLSREIRSAEAKLPAATKPNGMLNDPQISQLVDGIYVLLESLRQQPDPNHLKAALKHWDGMIAENRNFWTLVARETDNENEWVPNARQTSAIGIEIAQETADTWQRILLEADAVVKGQLLIPHPLLPDGTGINLKRYINNPAPLDLIGWVQGVSAYPYVDQGQRISDQTWQRLRRLSGGNATLFALFLN